MIRRLTLLVALVLAPLIAADKKHQWRAGKILEIREIEVPNVAASVITGALGGRTAYNKMQQVVIDDGTTVYEARQRWEQHKLDLSINGMNSFAVEGKKLFLIDDDKKTYEFVITRKTLKE